MVCGLAVGLRTRRLEVVGAGLPRIVGRLHVPAIAPEVVVVLSANGAPHIELPCPVDVGDVPYVDVARVVVRLHAFGGAHLVVGYGQLALVARHVHGLQHRALVVLVDLACVEEFLAVQVDVVGGEQPQSSLLQVAGYGIVCGGGGRCHYLELRSCAGLYALEWCYGVGEVNACPGVEVGVHLYLQVALFAQVLVLRDWFLGGGEVVVALRILVQVVARACVLQVVCLPCLVHLQLPRHVACQQAHRLRVLVVGKVGVPHLPCAPRPCIDVGELLVVGQESHSVTVVDGKVGALPHQFLQFALALYVVYLLIDDRERAALHIKLVRI